MVEDWEWDEDDLTLTVEYAEGWHWWNGDELTAEDNYWVDMLGHHSNPEASQWEEIELVDDYTIVYHFKEPQSPFILETFVSGGSGENVRGHRDKFQSWAEEMAEIDDQDERLQLEEELADEMPLQLSTAVE